MKQIFFFAALCFAIFYSISYYKSTEIKESKNSILVKDYVEAHKYRNYQKLKTMLLSPNDMVSVKFTTVSFDDYKIVSETENTVRISFKRFCYNDPEIDIVVQNGKIDFKNTHRNIISEAKNAKRNKVYCYPFKNNELEGILNGEYFKFNHYFFEKTTLENGEKVKRIFGEECDNENTKKCLKSIIDLSKLKIEGNGGNFSQGNYLKIINTQNDFDYLVNEGSYRITDEYNRLKIELSFKLDIDNQINGFFYINK